ncbi:eukaryotic initiation factor 3B [Salpingoeca rosetta]|uniref:Eukaryotic translation initiation factor 3 subunit B n=1 Tax=Salpingoeca rosetta (strain ATCC 50818 / BSB-021) TaxID=946362 RepID=F2TXW4_SALR5|nr:eukaryotic initiation factor 3B [Salpingoeca rosetta]EGD76223.1 eukaryotic initiation factor 3B [Salpingoeca rosetta]|eukprot:XP_004998398.1 eukaryotic initiation factor 3B [Salpingoeca rosetta]
MASRELTERDRPVYDDGLDNFILVDGVPVAPKAKLPLLATVLTKVFKEFKPKKVTLAEDPDTGNGVGAAYVEFSKPQDAKQACEKMNNHKLDKKHTFKTLPLSKFNEVMKTEEEVEFDLPEPGNTEDSLYSWLLEPNACDQFLLHSGTVVSVCKNRGPRRTTIESRDGWTQYTAMWSPKGTYLATIHQQGVALWGLPKFEQIGKFAHGGVRGIDFSPDERYLITCSMANKDKTVIVWDVETQKECRSFAIDLETTPWPVFKWSYDGNYFARNVENALLVYETKTFTKLGKKNIVIRDLKEFEWSPADNVIAYWTPGSKSVPYRVSLMKIPSRDELASRNMFKVDDCTMFWQKSGDHLCVRVAKTKHKKVSHDLEIFFLRKRDVPFEHIELDFEVVDVQWEPVGSKFAVLVKENAFKHRVVFYDFVEDKMTTIGEFDVPANTEISWSPRGEFCVLVPLRQPESRLKFLRVTDNKCEKLQEGAHDNVSMGTWDPTGRFFVSAVTRAGANLDFGYKMWWFTGSLVDEREEHAGLWSFQWRPRPASLLTEEEEAEVKKTLKSHWKQFEEADKLFSQQSSEEERDRRRALYKQWNDLYEKKKSLIRKYQHMLDSREGVDDVIQTVSDSKLVLVSQDRTPLEE